MAGRRIRRGLPRLHARARRRGARQLARHALAGRLGAGWAHDAVVRRGVARVRPDVGAARDGADRARRRRALAADRRAGVLRARAPRLPRPAARDARIPDPAAAAAGDVRHPPRDGPAAQRPRRHADGRRPRQPRPERAVRDPHHDAVHRADRPAHRGRRANARGRHRDDLPAHPRPAARSRDARRGAARARAHGRHVRAELLHLRARDPAARRRPVLRRVRAGRARVAVDRRDGGHLHGVDADAARGGAELRQPHEPRRADPGELMVVEHAEVIVTSPGRNFVTLKLVTSDGLVGYGDATLNGRELAVASYLRDHLLDLLIGRDAHRIEDTWQYLYRGAYWRGGPVTMAAIAAVDTALWDIKGKVAGLPVYQLLGGASRDGVMVYGHANGETIDDTVREALRYRDLGYRAIRLQSGVPDVGGTYGVRKGAIYEPAASSLPDEQPWDTEAYLRFAPT